MVNKVGNVGVQEDGVSYETHSVLVGAYKGRSVSTRATLTHAVRIESGRFSAVSN